MGRRSKWIVSALTIRMRTCTIQPCLNDEVIDRLGVDDLSETRGSEVSSLGVERDTLQIDGSLNRCEPHIA